MKRYVLAPLLIVVAGAAGFAALQTSQNQPEVKQPAAAAAPARHRYDDGVQAAGEAVVTRGLVGNPPAPSR